MTVKYIVHTTSTWRSTNGYSERFATITSTKTKKSLAISHVGGESNAAALLFRTPPDGTKPLAKGWDEVYSFESWESPRDWNRKAAFAEGDKPLYEHNVTPTMIRRLNRKA